MTGHFKPGRRSKVKKKNPGTKAPLWRQKDTLVIHIRMSFLLRFVSLAFVPRFVLFQFYSSVLLLCFFFRVIIRRTDSHFYLKSDELCFGFMVWQWHGHKMCANALSCTRMHLPVEFWPVSQFEQFLCQFGSRVATM